MCFFNNNKKRMKLKKELIEDIQKQILKISDDREKEFFTKFKGIMRYKIHLLEDKINITEDNINLKLDIIMTLLSNLDIKQLNKEDKEDKEETL